MADPDLPPDNHPRKFEEISFEILPPDRGHRPDPPTSDPPRNRPRSAFLPSLGIAIAVIADAIEVAFPPSWLLVDAITVAAFILIFGFRWEIFVALLPEAIPGVDFFPTWTLLAIHLKRDTKS
jgi:hypothetical protein